MDPASEIARRLTARREQLERRRRLDRRLSWWRGLVFLAGGITAWLALVSRTIPVGWLLLPVGVFLVLLPLHERILVALRQSERSVGYHEEIEARLEDRWAGRGRTGEEHRVADHPYADDLDLFGHGSLFERLCATRTSSGEATLAGWLLAPASLSEARRRQAAVAELRDRLDLREELALLGGEVRDAVDAEKLVAWAAKGPVAHLRRKRIAALAAASLLFLALIAMALGAGFPPVVLTALVAVGAAQSLARDRESAAATVSRSSSWLQLFGGLLGRLEGEPFQSELLLELQRRLRQDGEVPSRSIERLARLVDLLDARRNQLFLPLSLVLLWKTQLALAIEAWRHRHGRRISSWLRAVGEVEALLSLAGYSWERPADRFPELTERPATFDAEALGHPLLPDSRCVRNEVRLDGALRLLLVSGSNMSGKSTLLRAIGVSVVLGLAGGPVRAHRLRLSRLAIGASIRIVDSLQDGTSRFYAEIQRLARLLRIAEAGDPPLLFLLDEVLSGTNSHDRRIGAEAVVTALVERGAVGLVTTHDLALARIVDHLAPAAANVHFEDQIDRGRVSFDYRMRPGVVRRSNALELMRALDLPV